MGFEKVAVAVATQIYLVNRVRLGILYSRTYAESAHFSYKFDKKVGVIR
jgi:hypothetical protein